MIGSEVVKVYFAIHVCTLEASQSLSERSRASAVLKVVFVVMVKRQPDLDWQKPELRCGGFFRGAEVKPSRGSDDVMMRESERKGEREEVFKRAT